MCTRYVYQIILKHVESALALCGRPSYSKDFYFIVPECISAKIQQIKLEDNSYQSSINNILALTDCLVGSKTLI